MARQSTTTAEVECIQIGRRLVGIGPDAVHFESACERVDDTHRKVALFERAGTAQEQARLTLE
jgi:hypothetical protein